MGPSWRPRIQPRLIRAIRKRKNVIKVLQARPPDNADPREADRPRTPALPAGLSVMALRRSGLTEWRALSMSARQMQYEFERDEEMTVGDIVIAIIAKEMRVDTSRVSVASTMEELQVESLDAIQIIFEIEDRFQVSIPYDKSIHSLNCVGDIVSMVDRLLLEKKEVA